jgi:hypothetical protein
VEVGLGRGDGVGVGTGGGVGETVGIGVADGTDAGIRVEVGRGGTVGRSIGTAMGNEVSTGDGVADGRGDGGVAERSPGRRTIQSDMPRRTVKRPPRRTSPAGRRFLLVVVGRSGAPEPAASLWCTGSGFVASGSSRVVGESRRA